MEIIKIQERLLYMAKAIKHVLENNNIPYFITYGTLLGAVRHRGFIPWDDDFDFYLFNDTYDEAIELLRKYLPGDISVEDKNSEPKFFHGWAHVKDLRSKATNALFAQDGYYAHHGLSIDLYKATLSTENFELIFRITEHLQYLDRRYSVGLLSQQEYDSRRSKLIPELVCANQNYDPRNPGKEMYAFPPIYNDRIYPNELFPLTQYKFEDTEFLGPCNADIFLRRCYGDYMTLPPVEKRVSHYSSIQFI